MVSKFIVGRGNTNTMLFFFLGGVRVTANGAQLNESNFKQVLYMKCAVPGKNHEQVHECGNQMCDPW